jgi:two-component system sensor histidine kinase SenX3
VWSRPGKGSTFTLRLPVGAVPDQLLAAPPAARTIGTLPTPAPAQAATAAAAPDRVTTERATSRTTPPAPATGGDDPAHEGAAR